MLLPPSPGIAQRPAVREFIAEMGRKHGFGTAELTRAFDEAGTVPGILDAMAKPYEAKPWHAYRKLFLTEKRINGGREFMAANTAALAKAKSRYGVPPEMVTAIIGIESAYGLKPGKYRVIDSLSTLAFDYPRRASFFRGELEQFLLLCREEGMDYQTPLGSYAGAMGLGQFMPSSFHRFAVDFDGDGRRDLWGSADAIGSVAHYFREHGWRMGEAVAVPALARRPQAAQLKADYTTRYALGELSVQGVTPASPLAGVEEASLLRLDAAGGYEYWLGLPNFYVITRYNHSTHYAMAVHQLAEALRERHDHLFGPVRSARGEGPPGPAM